MSQKTICRKLLSVGTQVMARSFTFDNLSSKNPVTQVSFVRKTNPLKTYLG